MTANQNRKQSVDKLDHTNIKISRQWAEQQNREILALSFLQGRVVLDASGMPSYRHHKENSDADKQCRRALVKLIKGSNLPTSMRFCLAAMFSPDGDPGTEFKDGTARGKKLVVKNRHRGAEENYFRKARLSASVRKAEAEGKGAEDTANALMDEYGFGRNAAYAARKSVLTKRPKKKMHGSLLRQCSRRELNEAST